MKVALYTRVSTEDQAREGFSLTVQKNYLLQYIKNLDWKNFCSIHDADVYQDDGYSGYNMDRPAFQRLLTDARNKKFDLLIVYKQDRLSRNLRELLSFLEELQSLGIGFKSATEPFDTTSSAGKLAIQMLGSYAEFERNRLIERVFPGMVEGVKKGHWQGARYTPLGYIHNKETKKLEPHADESKMVKEIFTMYLNGRSTTQIAAHYYNLGVPSRNGGKFYTKFISDVLKNKVYLGTLVWNKRRYAMKEKTKDGHGKGYKSIPNEKSKIIEVPNAHEPLITQKEFDQVQRLLERNRRNGVVRFRNNIYHLSGVLKCNECGRPYRGKMVTTNRLKNKKKPWYYCASHGTPYYKCTNKAITEESVNQQVWEIIDVICQNIHLLEELGDIIKCSVEEPEECYVEQLEENERLLAKNLEKQRGIYEVYSEDLMNVDLYKEKSGLLFMEQKRLKSEIKNIHLKILQKRNKFDILKETQDFLTTLNKFPTTPPQENIDYALKTFMRIIFNSIYVQNQEIVKVEINQPWKFCYEEGLKCLKKTKKSMIQPERPPKSVQSFWRPTGVK
ncbi:MAG: recombinase family protein [Candidatus Omnitrophica bacterium]|nr:recombinase family protein [Candidatus Omnitrophota bacterium]